ncbi:SH3 domain-containing protein [Phormidium yuhuli AB48]|uniref:SH3 domain-containing protein n=1 Tax=Phormidium yuhuli AB48 TaxID=2940671 RepID=A0ABY5AUD7_9CYAN|nr:SH3 domain-containing protein [Phormidium yuhuli]USR92848.1 SH3 domain-containing protein [Phormidium yuhuli AB48]
MKFPLAFLPLALGTVLMGGNGAIAQSYPNDAHICTPGARLNLRESPGGRVLTVLDNRTSVERVAPPAGNWQPVAAGGQRGYVWSGYVCDGEATGAVAQRPAGTARFEPAMCPDVTLARNVIALDGLNIHRSNNPDSEILRFLSRGAAIILGSTNPSRDEAGHIWLPVEQPAMGYIRVGRDGVVDKIGNCTRFYD